MQLEVLIRDVTELSIQLKVNYLKRRDITLADQRRKNDVTE